MPTVGNTDPDLLLKIEEAHRESGLGIEDIVGLRKVFGKTGDLLDEIAPLPTWEFTPANG